MSTPPAIPLLINQIFWNKGVGHDSLAMWAAMLTGLCSPFPLLWLVQLLLWPFLSGPQLAEATPLCPALCSCSNQASRVICTRKELTEVPQSISVNTRYLNLQENSIEVNAVNEGSSDLSTKCPCGCRLIFQPTRRRM